MIACIFGLTACGSEEVLTEFEQLKVSNAETISVNGVIPVLASFMNDEMAESYSELTMDEIAYVVGNNYNINVDGYAFASAIESFHSAAESVGEIQSIGEVKAEIDGNQIIVEVNVTGTGKDAVAELIFSNDMFMILESAALNPVSTMGELMTNAALNTVIGMGTVFVVLILISFIISCFNIIPKLQNRAAEKTSARVVGQEKESPVAESTVDTAITEEIAEDDDQELVAVIAAAIAAFEGSASTDGFVVRSIRRQQRM